MLIQRHLVVCSTIIQPLLVLILLTHHKATHPLTMDHTTTPGTCTCIYMYMCLLNQPLRLGPPCTHPITNTLRLLPIITL